MFEEVIVEKNTPRNRPDVGIDPRGLKPAELRSADSPFDSAQGRRGRLSPHVFAIPTCILR